MLVNSLVLFRVCGAVSTRSLPLFLLSKGKIRRLAKRHTTAQGLLVGPCMGHFAPTLLTKQDAQSILKTLRAIFH